MKLAHLADLHIGKTVNGYSMLEDQTFILNEILKILDQEKVDGVLIAGDVFDRAVPSAEAIHVFEDFLNSLGERKVEIFMIAGNHDSGERLSFGSHFQEQSHLHNAGIYEGHLDPVVLQDAYGEIDFWLLPYVRPMNVNAYIEKEEDKISGYTAAVQYILDHAEMDETKRNVILAHQFVTGSKVDQDGSEELTLGGTDEVSAELFERFDYAALGHIHRPQKLLKDTIRYAGTPIPYSFGEAKFEKSMPIVELKEKGNTEVELIPLHPLHGMRTIRGSFDEIRANASEDSDSEDYMHIILTDETEIPDAAVLLRNLYPNLMNLEYERTMAAFEDASLPETQKIHNDPKAIFEDFFAERTGHEMSEEEKGYIASLVEEIWNGKEEA
jgi:exonuclease SbcD